MSNTCNKQGKNAADTLKTMRENLQKEVHQLCKEAAIERWKNSECVTDLLQFCSDNASGDPLLHGSPPVNNPFAEKKKCSAL